MQQEYTYAVARIRFKETQLLSDSDLDRLLSAKDMDEAMRLLHDKGWGDNTSDKNVEALLSLEEKKLWDFVKETVTEDSELYFLKAPDDFHNVKVAVKCITRDVEPEGLFLYNSIVVPEEVYESIKTREYQQLPEFLQETAQEAMTTLLQTSDGQLCDIIVDKACMEYVYSLGKESDNEIIRLYCELYVAAADIKIAVRCAKTGKQLDFIKRALAECDSLDIEALAAAAYEGYDAILNYLSTTEYSAAVEEIRASMSSFEKWCDDYLTSVMKPQKWEPFGIGPIVAYIIARRNELKAVRMIFSAKTNNLPEDTVKERLRSMYV